MKINDVVRKLPRRKEEFLSILQKSKFPVTLNEINRRLAVKEFTPIKRYEITEIIRYLEKRGYEIKEIEGKVRKYSLLRFAEIKREDFYRPVGNISTPLIGGADFHIGSKHFTEQGFFTLVDQIKEEKVKHILLVGDVLQGLGIYREELPDLMESDIDKQVEMAADYLSEIPRRCKIHISEGGHEKTYRSRYKVGFNALASLARQLPNCSYYGGIMNFILNKKFRLLALHGMGGPTYAASYRLEKVYRELPDPRPHVLFLAHTHRITDVYKPPDRLLAEVGTLQRETTFTLWRGWVSQIGWVLLRDMNEEVVDYKVVRPRVF